MASAVPALPAIDFLNVKQLAAPKEIASLEALSDEIFKEQALSWTNQGVHPDRLQETFQELLDATRDAVADSTQGLDRIAELLASKSNQTLFGVVRALHFKLHMRELDRLAQETTGGGGPPVEKVKLILQSLLDFLQGAGPDADLAAHIQQYAIRLVSTVHPNETERNTNLMHYAAIHEAYARWRTNREAIRSIPKNAPSYRLMREALNQTRRDIKGELESLWQADQMRNDPIPVQSEATRILERYKVLFRAYPLFVKFVKQLAFEAYYLHQAHCRRNDPAFIQAYLQALRNQQPPLPSPSGAGSSANPHIDSPVPTRDENLRSIKMALRATSSEPLNLPHVHKPLVTFGTWKGGDRDGNPFVVASFTNVTFVDHKEFVLRHYIAIAKELIDRLTGSTRHMKASQALLDSVAADATKFPYLDMIKQHEPYRAKARYILEKLENTYARTLEVKKRAGDTVKPLLGLTLPGPSGYSKATELCEDVEVLYTSLRTDGAKSQARSLTQDLHILVQAFGLHLASVDFRQTSEKNLEALAAALALLSEAGYLELPSTPFASLPEAQRQALLQQLLLSPDLGLLPPHIRAHMPSSARDTLDTLSILADAKQADPNAVGPLIISMCGAPSDVLGLLLLLRFCGLASLSPEREIICPFDICGLFETVADLRACPELMRILLCDMKLYRSHTLRRGNVLVMLGYSDSVRDGSSLTSDAEVASCALRLKDLQELSKIPIQIYRGRGDTLPRGFGGSIYAALSSQLYTSPVEHHTEQNRYLRRYFSVPSALNHLHTVYSAHLFASAQLPPPGSVRFQRYFTFMGRLSSAKWRNLVAEEYGGNGKLYFQILTKYTILQHLPRSHFASRPVARDGITYNIEKIRAIPFTMVLAQMREFTSGYYGAGTAFELASKLLHLAPAAVDDDSSPLLGALIAVFPNKEAAVAELKALQADLAASQQTFETLLTEMYEKHLPFRISMDNKATSLLVRNNRVVQQHVRHATKQEKDLLAMTEAEAELTRGWLHRIRCAVGGISSPPPMVRAGVHRNWEAPELYLLQMIQIKWLQQNVQLSSKEYRSALPPGELPTLPEKIDRLHKLVQMSILAVSEALGFAG
jgi:phosphoenolpyruvate carboxylase